MRQVLQLTLLFVLMLVLGVSANAQWECLYATWDNEANGTGRQVMSVGVVKENMFIALITYRDQN